jgi:hypothetical protein
MPLCGDRLSDLPLHFGWGKNVKSAVLRAMSLTHFAIVPAHGWAASAHNPRARQPVYAFLGFVRYVPAPRPAQPREKGKMVAKGYPGGLHHCCSRAA